MRAQSMKLFIKQDGKKLRVVYKKHNACVNFDIYDLRYRNKTPNMHVSDSHNTTVFIIFSARQK